MKATLNNWLPVFLLSLPACIGNACAVERTRPSMEERVQSAELVVVTDDFELLPHTGPKTGVRVDFLSELRETRL